MKYCANCERDLVVPTEEYGPPGAPVCWDCHVGIIPPREPEGLDLARADLLQALERVIELADEAEGYQDRADELESEADELREGLAETYGLDVAALRTIERESKWQAAAHVDWTKLPALAVPARPTADGAALPLFGAMV